MILAGILAVLAVFSEQPGKVGTSHDAERRADIGLKVDVYPNAAHAGTPSSRFRALNLSNLTFPSVTKHSVFSVSILGSLRPPYELAASNEVWDIRCLASEGLSVFLHLDDHLVCQSGHDNKTWVDFKAQTQIPFEGAVYNAMTNASYTIRAALVHHKPTDIAPSFTVAFRRVKRSNDLPPLVAPKYIGCFAASADHLLINATPAGAAQTASPGSCSEICRIYRFFGLSSGFECWCGDTYGVDSSSNCTIPCPGNVSTLCGGLDSRSVYQQHSGNDVIPLHPVPSGAFAGAVRTAQIRWLNSSRWLTDGRWGTYSRNSLTTHVLLPMGLMVKIGVCRYSTRTCKLDVPIDGLGNDLRLGPIANDFAYTQLSFHHDGANFSVETSQPFTKMYADLAVRVSSVGSSPINTSDYCLVAAATFADEEVPDASWHLPGHVTANMSGFGTIEAVAAGRGLPTVKLRGAQLTSRLGFSPTALPWLAWPLSSNGSAIFATGADARSSQQLNILLDEAKAAELATYTVLGEHAEAKMVSQLAGMWMVQHFPGNPGLFAVTGGWSRIYTIFCWDSVFAAYQLSIDGGAGKELAYSTLATVLHTQTAQGLIPNFWQASQNGVSYDRTEEPLGAKVLLEMFRRHQDRWVVDLLYPALYDSLDWFWRKRRAGIGLVVLGSDVGLPTRPHRHLEGSGAGSWGGSRDECCDNSPMYDVIFDGLAVLVRNLNV